FGDSVATIGPLRQQWNRAWPPAALAPTLVATIIWISLLGYLVFSLVGYLYLAIGNAVTGGDQRFQIENRDQPLPMLSISTRNASNDASLRSAGSTGSLLSLIAPSR